MVEMLKNGGLGRGGLNFDAKVRRGSFEPEDLFIAHIAGMDAFAVGLKVAHRLLKDGVLDQVLEKRYRSFTEGIGKEIVEGKADFHKLEQYVLDLTEIRKRIAKDRRDQSDHQPVLVERSSMRCEKMTNGEFAMKYVIGVDLGTSAVKILLVNQRDKWSGKFPRPIP